MPLDSMGSAGPLVQAGEWTVALDQPVPALSGTLPALAARHATGRKGFALACRPDLPPRTQALASLPQPAPEALLVPQAMAPARLPGAARESLLAVFPLPPGPPVLTAHTRCRPWSEAELIHDLLRPVARVLAALDQLALTHRAVRVDNLFRAREGGPVSLGDGFCLPSAFGQPAWCESPAMAQCVPEGRGAGQPADDVFALGIALICVAAGRVPWAGIDPRTLHRQRLEKGSFNALTTDLRLPGSIADLLRAMLADDPELRPSAELVAGWPSALQGRKGAARPVRRAGRPLVIGAEKALDTRTAAWLLATGWSEGVRTLRSGALDGFLRRGIGDPALAERLAETVRAETTERPDTADDMAMCRAIAMLDPTAPLVWRGVAMMPDGIGTLLARAACDPANAPLQVADIAALVHAEAPARWALSGGDSASAAVHARAGAQWRVMLRTKGLAGGIERLLYQLNPGLPCLSPILRGAWTATPADLLAALEAAAPPPDEAGQAGPPPPPDHDIAAYLAARQGAAMERSFAELAGPAAVAATTRIALLARLQARHAGGRKLPRLAAWLAASCDPVIETWHSRLMRESLPARLAEAARAGDLTVLLGLLDDPAARQADLAGAQAAQAELAAIEAELAAIAAGAPTRRLQARATGEQAAAGVSLTCLLGIAMWLAAG